VVQAKLPETDAVPPFRVDALSACPEEIALAVGHADTVVVALLTVTLTLTCGAALYELLPA
jgi:hypothetical protein